MTAKQPSEQEAVPAFGSSEMLQEERYLWMARAFVVMLVLAVVCDIVLLIALSSVTPVMRVQPFYIDIQNKSEQIIAVARPSAEVLNSDALRESLVRQYLEARYGIEADLNKLRARWGEEGPVYWMSDPGIYEEFKSEEANPLEELAAKENLTRNVTIGSVNWVPKTRAADPDMGSAMLRIDEANRASTTKEMKCFRADFVVDFRPRRKGLTWKNRLKNPLGFVVTDFGLTTEEKSRCEGLGQRGSTSK